MLMHNQPVALDLPIYVRDPHREIDRLVLGVGAPDVLNGMAIAERSGGKNVQVGDLDFTGPMSWVIRPSQSSR